MKKKIMILLVGIISIYLLTAGCIETNKAPVASFEIQPENVSVNMTIYFNSTSSDDKEIINYTWSIDGINIGYEEKTTYIFTNEKSYLISLTVTDDEGLSDTDLQTVFIGDASSYFDKFFGTWEWSGNNQTGLWTFYSNSTLKSLFTGQWGATVLDWWYFSINGSQLCFYNPSDDQLDGGCYTFSFSENNEELTIGYLDNIATWYKVV